MRKKPTYIDFIGVGIGIYLGWFLPIKSGKVDIPLILGIGISSAICQLIIVQLKKSLFVSIIFLVGTSFGLAIALQKNAFPTTSTWFFLGLAAALPLNSLRETRQDKGIRKQLGSSEITTQDRLLGWSEESENKYLRNPDPATIAHIFECLDKPGRSLMSIQKGKYRFDVCCGGENKYAVYFRTFGPETAEVYALKRSSEITTDLKEIEVDFAGYSGWMPPTMLVEIDQARRAMLVFIETVQRDQTQPWELETPHNEVVLVPTLEDIRFNVGV